MQPGNGLNTDVWNAEGSGYLISVSLDHNVNYHSNQLRSNSFSPMLLFDGQHGNVTPQRASPMGFQLGDHNAKQGVVPVQGLGFPLVSICILMLKTTRNHEAQIPPLIKEIFINIDAIGFGQVIGNQLSDCGKVYRFLATVVLNVLKL